MKHLILRTTNGEGYADHSLMMFTEDFHSAESTFNEQVGQLCRYHFDVFNQESELTSDNQKNYKAFMLTHLDNDAVIWLQGVQPRTLITINTDYSTDIEVKTDTDNILSDIVDTFNVESSYECDSFSTEDKETGTVYHYIYIK